MTIPEITQKQVDTLVSTATGLGAFSFPLPDMKKDTYEQYQQMSAELCDINQLVIMGLLKDISDKCGEKLATMYAMSNRQFRVYEITDIGKAMFSGPERMKQ